jgi:hypothetical protein
MSTSTFPTDKMSTNSPKCHPNHQNVDQFIKLSTKSPKCPPFTNMSTKSSKCQHLKPLLCTLTPLDSPPQALGDGKIASDD